MADWVKINHTILRSSKIRALMRVMKCRKHTALGVALHWLILVDEQTTDGKTTLLPEELDDELGFRGGAEALCEIGWAALDEDGSVRAVDYEKHCGETAKARAINARRVAQCTARKKEREIAELVDANEKTLAGTNEKSLAEKKRKEYIKDVLQEPNKYTVVTSGDEPPKARSGKPLPASAEEVQRVMAGQAICGLRGDDLAQCAASFFDDMEARGWTAGPHNAPLQDWHAAARKYLRSWQTNQLSGSGLRRTAQPTRYRSETKPDYSL